TGLVAPPSLQRALDETPSNVSVKLVGELSIRPNFIFVSLQKRWCREYTVVYANRMEAPALACRGDDGIWRVEAQEDPPKPSQISTDSKAYARAGDQAKLVAEHRDRIMGAELSLEDEA